MAQAEIVNHEFAVGDGGVVFDQALGKCCVERLGGEDEVVDGHHFFGDRRAEFVEIAIATNNERIGCDGYFAVGCVAVGCDDDRIPGRKVGDEGVFVERCAGVDGGLGDAKGEV